MKYIFILLASSAFFVSKAQITPVKVAPVPIKVLTTTAPQKTSNTSPSQDVGTTTDPAGQLIGGGAEPAGVKGYISWVDPSTGQKHMLKGQDNRSGDWKYASEYPSMAVQFTKNGQVEWVNLSSGSYYVPVNKDGRELSRYSSNWTVTDPPVAFKYDISFRFDLNYNGPPVLQDDNRTIRYNPTIYRFYDVRIQLPFLNANNTTGITIPTGDFPDRPIEQRRRLSKFTDLPDF